MSKLIFIFSDQNNKWVQQNSELNLSTDFIRLRVKSKSVKKQRKIRWMCTWNEKNCLRKFVQTSFLNSVTFWNNLLLPIRLIGEASNLSAIKSMFFFIFIVFIENTIPVVCIRLSFYLFFWSFFLIRKDRHTFNLKVF